MHYLLENLLVQWVELMAKIMGVPGSIHISVKLLFFVKCLGGAEVSSADSCAGDPGSNPALCVLINTLGSGGRFKVMGRLSFSVRVIKYVHL